MSKSFRFKAFLLSLLVITCQQASADVVSLESNFVAGQSDVTTKLNNDRTALVNGVNNVRGVFAGGIQTSGQIKADTIGEENMADDANPRIRTAEGASCTDLVSSGLLPATSSSLVLTIPAGIAYPDGYRIEKTSSTAANLTASKWTYYYILTSGSFSTNEVTIGASTPASPAGSAILFRASSDATTINAISDLRRTSCTAGPFSVISDVTGEAALSDIFANGQPVRRYTAAGRTPVGHAQGLFVSFDSTTTFKVTSGSAYINGKYRAVSTDVTVTTAADAPGTGGSGLDTGTVTGGPLRYYVYAVADQDEVKTLSASFSTSATAPTGVTNSRLIGSLRTDINNNFTSSDVSTVHGVSEYELPFAWIRLDGSTGAPKIKGAYNIGALAETATGVWSTTFNSNPNSANYSIVGTCGANGAPAGNFYLFLGGTIAAGSATFACVNSGAAAVTAPDVFVQFIGDNRR